MFYRENGQFKTSYRADQQLFADRTGPVARHRAARGCRFHRRAAAGERLRLMRADVHSRS
jgi:hypothetical protein